MLSELRKNKIKYSSELFKKEVNYYFQKKDNKNDALLKIFYLFGDLILEKINNFFNNCYSNYHISIHSKTKEFYINRDDLALDAYELLVNCMKNIQKDKINKFSYYYSISLSRFFYSKYIKEEFIAALLKTNDQDKIHNLAW